MTLNSAKNKIYITIVVWVALSLSMFGYFFQILNKSNKALTATINGKARELSVLESEKQSFKQAQTDLEKLDQEKFRPDMFFSRDVTLVNEVRMLEAVAEQYEVEALLAGLRGTLKEAQKAKTKGEVFIVPFTLNVTGAFPNVLSYIETLENLPFLINISSMGLSAPEEGVVNVNLTANFYLKR